jgi:hypothetical protein
VRRISCKGRCPAKMEISPLFAFERALPVQRWILFSLRDSSLTLQLAHPVSHRKHVFSSMCAHATNLGFSHHNRHMCYSPEPSLSTPVRLSRCAPAGACSGPMPSSSNERARRNTDDRNKERAAERQSVHEDKRVGFEAGRSTPELEG